MFDKISRTCVTASCPLCPFAPRAPPVRHARTHRDNASAAPAGPADRNDMQRFPFTLSVLCYNFGHSNDTLPLARTEPPWGGVGNEHARDAILMTRAHANVRPATTPFQITSES
ncbi:unnamed protein product [Leptosia nina]|uniref:Uncharacterized protein n=1 Tax=Leptosia nina TaxID=320188 RepID=A0AAV1JQQ6_9NEOP